MKKVLFSVFFILLSCSRGHDLEKYDNIYFIKSLNPQINKFETIDWKAGINEEKILSRGFLINQDLIELSQKTKEILSSEYRVDSWIYRFMRTTSDGKKEIIGQAVIHFDRISRTFKNFSAIFYYSAAAVSHQFRNFKCPAFDHRKKIQEIEITDFGHKTDKLYIDRNESVVNNLNSGQIFPITFNGGKSLEGEYVVEVALYSSSLRTTYSKWLQLRNKVLITKEHNISVASCIGIKEEEKPLPDSGGPNILDFQIR